MPHAPGLAPAPAFFRSEPAFPRRPGRPCLIVGSALHALEDVEASRQRLSQPPIIIAVNGAARELKAEILYSHHADRLETRGWIRNQRRLFGPGFTVHSRNLAKYGPLLHVEHWWNVEAGGGSAWEARKIAASIGFAPIILCGCPMEAGPYRSYKLDGLLQDPAVADDLFRQIESDTAWHAGCFSMSGRTRELLGLP